MLVGTSEETRFLDRGDGVCKYFDLEAKTCRKYESRPKICRVDEMYDLMYSDAYSWSEFVELNLSVCDALEKSFGR